MTYSASQDKSGGYTTKYYLMHFDHALLSGLLGKCVGQGQELFIPRFLICERRKQCRN